MEDLLATLKRNGQSRYFRTISEYNKYKYFLQLIPDDLIGMKPPSFDQYQIWRDCFPAWVFGKLDRNHLAWCEDYEGASLPMNKWQKEIQINN
jgi:hypothetical protein